MSQSALEGATLHLIYDPRADLRRSAAAPDANGIAFSRTPRQIANIVLLDTTGKAAKGGFFPDGLSGNSVTGDYSSILSL